MSDAMNDRILQAFDEPVRGDLPTDTQDTDNVSIALEERTKRHLDRDALQWLVDGDLGEEAPPDLTEINDDEIPQVDIVDDRPLWRRVAGDVGSGIMGAPKQAVGGVIDAIGQVGEAAQAIGEAIEKRLPAGGVQLFNPETGEFDLEYISSPEFAESGYGAGTLSSMTDSITTEESDSTTGNIIRNVVQFLTPFTVASKAMGGLKAASTVGSFGKAATAGAVADFTAFDGNEERLSNLIEAAPSLQNPITEFLAADENDTEVEGRLKNAVEGLGAGIVVDGLLRGLRAYRSWSNAPDPVKDALRKGEAIETLPPEELLREAKETNLLGDPTADLVVRNIVDAPATGVPDDVVAKSLTEKGLTPLGETTDGVYVNFSKIDTPDDIQRVIQDTSTAFKDDIDAARRGVRTNEQTVLSASQEDAWDLLLNRRKGEAMNAEQSYAARQLWVSAGEKLKEVSKIAAENPSDENLFQFRRMLATFHGIQKEVIAARSETARALQQWSIPVGGNMERMRDIGNALEMSGGRTNSQTMAEMVYQMSISENAVGLSKFAEKGMYAKSRDTLMEYWINALLSGPKTHMVNAASNSAVIAWSIMERGVAGGMRSLAGGQGVEVGEALAQVNGLMNGIGDAFRNAGKAFRTGQTGFGVNKVEVPRTRAISSGNWNLASQSWLGKGVDALGAIVNIPGRGLQTADEFFKTINYRAEIHAQAFRQAKQAVDTGKIQPEQFKQYMADVVENPPEAIRMASADMAAYNTFTNSPGPFTQKINSVKADYPAIGFILPFVNTPANILSYTFERTPLAPLSKRYRNAIAEGGAKADMARAKMALGTMTSLFALDLAMNGHLTGSGPSSRTEMQNWRRQGFQPYSVKLGDKWVAYNRLDPLGYLLGMGADIGEYMNNADFGENTTEELQEVFAATVFSVMESMTSKSYLQGVAMLAEAISDPQRFAPTYIERLASSFVPTGVAEVARFQDPVMRQSHDIITSMKRRIPGFTDDLPPRRDLWGRPLKYESGLGKAYDAVSPLYVSQYKPEPVDEAMEKDGWFIGAPSKILTVDGERVSLKNNPEIYSEYLRLQGSAKPSEFGAEGLVDRYGDKPLLEVLNDVVTGKADESYSYENATDPEEKRDVVNKIVRRYRSAARDKILRDNPVLNRMARDKKLSRIER